MTEITQQDQSLNWQKEFKIDDSTGQSFGSKEGLARLSGVSRQAIQQLLKQVKGGCKQKPPKELESFAGQDFIGGKQLPDILMAAVIQYYSFKGIETAQRTLMAMSAIGLRTYVQKQLNWQLPRVEVAQSLPPKASESPENKATLEALSTVAQTMITSGVSASIAHQWQIEQIGKVLPGLQAGLKAAGAIISAANPANPLPINCNEIGRRVGKYLGLEPAPSAIKINKALEKIGMQRRDEVASKWRLTEAGEKYGDLQSTVVNGYTREHIRWYDEVIELLVSEFTPENTLKQ
jgi:hypothetical protein